MEDKKGSLILREARGEEVGDGLLEEGGEENEDDPGVDVDADVDDTVLCLT